MTAAASQADDPMRRGPNEVPDEKEAAPSTSASGVSSSMEDTETQHVLIEPENAGCDEVAVAAGQQSSEESPESPPRKRRAPTTWSRLGPPGGENEMPTKKRRRRSRRSHVSTAGPGAVVHVSDVSSDEVSVDSRRDDLDGAAAVDDGYESHQSLAPLASARPIPTHVTADTVTKPLRRIPLLPTKAPMQCGSGVFYDGAELPVAFGNHPLMSSPAPSPSPSKGVEQGLLMSDDDARSFLQAPEEKALHPTAFLPLLPCPKLPSRPVVMSSMPFIPSKTDDSKKDSSIMSLDGSRHILTEEANRILQQEKMDRLRSYLVRRDAMKRRRRKKGHSEDEDNDQKKENPILVQRLPLLPVVEPTPSPPLPPSSSNNIVKFNSCTPDVLDAALALTSCLSRAPSLPSKEGPKKNFTEMVEKKKVVPEAGAAATSSSSSSFFRFDNLIAKMGGAPLAAPSLCRPLQ